MPDDKRLQDELLQIYRLMYRSRAFQSKLLELRKEGLIKGGLYLEPGEEGISIGCCLGLNEEDVINPYYRGEGVCLQIRGVLTRELMSWWLGKKGETCEVRSVIPSSCTDIGRGIIGLSDSCLGSNIDISLGAALAFKLQAKPNVALTMFGDGATGRGNFHEALTFASVLKLLMVFVCRNNGWAMSMPTSRGVPVENIAEKASSYGMPGFIVDGNDVTAVRNQVRVAADRARRGMGPSLIEAKTYRLGPHSANDEDNYRSEEEKSEWAQKDPLIRLAQRLKAAGATEEQLRLMRLECELEIEYATEWAMNRPSIQNQEIRAAQSKAVKQMWGGRSRDAHD